MSRSPACRGARSSNKILRDQEDRATRLMSILVAAIVGEERRQWVS
jgi:hypothetical protein